MWWTLLIFYLLLQIPLGIVVGTFIKQGAVDDKALDTASVALKCNVQEKIV